MRQTSGPLRPVMPLLCLAYLLLIVNPIDGGAYRYRTGRQKRSPYANIARSQSDEIAKTPAEIQAKLERVFKVGDGQGVVLFNDSAQPTFKVQRSPDGKLNVVYNDFLIFQNTTSGTPTHNNNYNSYKTTPPTRHNDAIIFPNDKYICPERRQGKPYCLDVPDYLNATQIDKIDSEQFAQFKHFFRDDILQPSNITERTNGPLDEYYCYSTQRVIYPKSAQAKDATWQLLVQHNEYKQGILVEQCDNEDQPCRFEELLRKGYTSRCKQHYVYRTMAVVVAGKMKEEQVKMPNCCKCVLRNTTL